MENILNISVYPRGVLARMKKKKENKKTSVL